MKTSCSALDRCIREKIVERCYYIDRIRLQVNDLSARDSVANIVRNAPSFGKVTLTPGFEMYSKPRRKSASRIAVKFALDLVGPSISALAELADCLVKSHYSLSWLEIAYDLNLNSQREAVDCLDLLAEMIVVPSIRKLPTFEDRRDRVLEDDATSYKSVFFGRYEDARMFNMYIPAKGRKMFGETSVHTEFLLKGAEEIRRNGLFTLRDLVDLDLVLWYRDRVKVRALDKKAIGASLRSWEGKEPASDRQCQKDFERVFGTARAKAQQVYHHPSKVLRNGLVCCSDRWLDGQVW